jgi:predicted Rossmann-fold nucleotide-binding protein
MAKRVLLFESHKKSVIGIRPKYKVESAHYVDLSRDYVLTVKKFRRRKRHLDNLLKLQHILYFAR